jgi:formamidopyrimidine-DNA glycosylase
MPELPEVETVVRGLRIVLPGRRILQVRLGKTDFIDDPAAIERNLPGTRVRSVERSGKFIVISLEPLERGSPSLTWLVHLGMTGSLVVSPREAPVRPHTHVFVDLDDGRELRYTDPRRFGRMQLIEEGGSGSALTELGHDPLEITEAQFVAAIGGRKARIKALLMDQHVLRGMGNIYTDESLWRAKIHPAQLGTGLKKQQIQKLYRIIQAVLKEAIRFRGSSISNYVDADGQRGWFQQRHRVYGREGKKCTRCGSTIRRCIVAGRSTHFCPQCQRAPRSKKKRADVPVQRRVTSK